MVFRVRKNNNYTIMSNYHLREKEMSLNAKGLLSWMLSLPDNWDYSLAGIVACCKEGKTVINTTLKELQKFGYVKVIKKKPDVNNNRIHYEYNVYEKPQDSDSQELESQVLESQELESQVPENQVQINTNKINTKEKSIKEINTKKESSENQPFLKNHSKQKSNKAEIQSIVNLYNEVCTNLSKVRALTDKRQKAISNILKSYDFNTIKEVFENANNNSFLTGDNDRGWKADLDFILREDKFVKILENGYGSNKGKGYKKRNKDKFAEPEYLSCERYNPDEDEFGKELDASGKQRYF